MRGTQRLVCFTSVICVVTQREDEWGVALRDNTKNGCEAADYPTPDVSKYVKSVSNGFLYALEACLIIWSCPKIFFSVRMS